MVAEKLAPFRRQIELFKDIAAATAIVGQRHDWWPCRRGCSLCCHQPFPIAESEWRFLQLGITQLEPQQRRRVRQQAKAQVRAMRAAVGGRIEWTSPKTVTALARELEAPCPFVDADGSCMVYTTRPAICRIYGYGVTRLDLPGAPVSLALCSIIQGEVRERNLRGEDVEVADLTDIRAEMGRAELGPHKSIAEWVLAG